MRVLSLFSGVGGIEMGLEQAGHTSVAFCEIEPHAQAVLRYHWPAVPLYTDICALSGRELVAAHGAMDLVCGGSPCQDLSTAGKRAGLGGEKSGLFHQQIRVWQELQAAQPDVPVTLLWENVAGAFSSHKGADFAAVLSAIVGTDITGAVGAVPDKRGRYKWTSAGVATGPAAIAAWRLLDLQYFGVPQRRRRVFVVGSPPGGPDPAEVLALSEGLYGDPAPSGRAGQDNAPAPAKSTGIRGERPEPLFPQDAETYAIRTAQTGSNGWGIADEVAYTLDGSAGQAVSFSENQQAEVRTAPIMGSLSGIGGKPGQGYPAILEGRPRRLTPLECDRLMGWPDDHTKRGEKPDGTQYDLPDGARYVLCGNGCGAPHSSWIGWQLWNALQY